MFSSPVRRFRREVMITTILAYPERQYEDEILVTATRNRCGSQGSGMIDIRHLTSFPAVAGERTITRAAARLHLTQQTVSTHVHRIERALGITLLVRTSRGVLLTPADAELAAGGQAVVDDLAAPANRVRAVASGQAGAVHLAWSHWRTSATNRPCCPTCARRPRPSGTGWWTRVPPTARRRAAGARRRWRTRSWTSRAGGASGSHRGHWAGSRPPGTCAGSRSSTRRRSTSRSVWTDRAPRDVIARLVAEVRSVTGFRDLHAA